MKSKRLTAKDKILIALEFLETDVEMADLCRKRNVTPRAFSKWKTMPSDPESFQEAEKIILSAFVDYS